MPGQEQEQEQAGKIMDEMSGDGDVVIDGMTLPEELERLAQRIEESKKKPAPVTPQWIENVVSYHKPTDEEVERISDIRCHTALFMSAIARNCPPCADRTAALRKAREAMMTATASVVLKGLV